MSSQIIVTHPYYIIDIFESERQFVIKEEREKPKTSNLALNNYHALERIYKSNFDMRPSPTLSPSILEKKYPEFILMEVAIEIKRNFEHAYFKSCCKLIEIIKRIFSIFPCTKIYKMRKAYKSVVKAYEQSLSVTSKKLREHLNDPNRFNKWHELNSQVEELERSYINCINNIQISMLKFMDTEKEIIKNFEHMMSKYMELLDNYKAHAHPEERQSHEAHLVDLRKKKKDLLENNRILPTTQASVKSVSLAVDKRFAEFTLIDLAKDIKKKHQQMYYKSTWGIVRLFKRFCALFPWSEMYKMRHEFAKVEKSNLALLAASVRWLREAPSN